MRYQPEITVRRRKQNRFCVATLAPFHFELTSHQIKLLLLDEILQFAKNAGDQWCCKLGR